MSSHSRTHYNTKGCKSKIDIKQ